MKHGLGPGEDLPTHGAGAPTGPVLLLQVPVQSLHEGRPDVTHMAPPWLVVHVVPMHMVHQPSEPTALLLTNLTDAESFVVF